MDEKLNEWQRLANGPAGRTSAARPLGAANPTHQLSRREFGRLAAGAVLSTGVAAELLLPSHHIAGQDRPPTQVSPDCGPQQPVRDATAAEPFRIELSVARQGFDGQSCWVHARAGTIPAEQTSTGSPRVVMTMQRLLLSGSDVFYGLNQLHTDDLGASWIGPTELPTFVRRTFRQTGDEPPPGASVAPQWLLPGDETVVSDFTPKWHANSGRLLGTGHTVWYRNNRVLARRPRSVAYAVLDPATFAWADWRVLELPDLLEFTNAGAGSGQRVDREDGEVLVAIYHKDPAAETFSVTVCRCGFDGERMTYREHGNRLTIDGKRGLYEPSLAQWQGRYYLTMRNDDHGYVSVSDDGLNYAQPRRWLFDDGNDLGNYNTQQHWVAHRDGLYLVYTRRGAGNDHVFRHRAPLFIARVDPQRLCVIRSSERVVVPQRGARLGNFGVCEVSPDEIWITAAEWMQPQGVERHGSDTSLFVAKLRWS
jgi:hypothetical protein